MRSWRAPELAGLVDALAEQGDEHPSRHDEAVTLSHGRQGAESHGAGDCRRLDTEERSGVTEGVVGGLPGIGRERTHGEWSFTWGKNYDFNV
jgi:hypothetical protein